MTDQTETLPPTQNWHAPITNCLLQILPIKAHPKPSKIKSVFEKLRKMNAEQNLFSMSAFLHLKTFFVLFVCCIYKIVKFNYGTAAMSRSCLWVWLHNILVFNLIFAAFFDLFHVISLFQNNKFLAQSERRITKRNAGSAANTADQTICLTNAFLACYQSKSKLKHKKWSNI